MLRSRTVSGRRIWAMLWLGGHFMLVFLKQFFDISRH